MGKKTKYSDDFLLAEAKKRSLETYYYGDDMQGMTGGSSSSGGASSSSDGSSSSDATSSSGARSPSLPTIVLSDGEVGQGAIHVESSQEEDKATMEGQ